MYCYCGPQSKSEQKRKDWYILVSIQRIEKAVEYEGNDVLFG